MRIVSQESRSGVALLMVMVAIFVLSVMVGAFAYAMKVDTKLAQNANNEENLIWLGRSGVELARYVLAEQMTVNGEPYDSLNQKWAGGPGGIASSNSPLAGISLDNFSVGDGSVTIKITDLERKINVNMANEPILQQALTSMGVDASEAPGIIDGILDWIDLDDATRANGAESDYYQSMDPPYFAKNGAIDDLSELLLIRGISQDVYWGAASTNHTAAAFQQVDRLGRPIQQPVYSAGLVDIFTPISTGRVNINTASATVLQAIPGIDQNMADQIIKLRSGPDGADGTDDDTPFLNVGEVINAGVSRQAVQQVAQYCDVRSRTFEVRVEAEIGGTRRTFYAIVGRNSPRDLPVLSFYWK
jgi:type II secretory pathway component PulK